MNHSRRALFARLLRPTADRAEHGPAPDFGSLAGDLPPELLAMEAERLGLAPGADRAELVAAVHEAMLALGKEKNPESPEAE